MGGDHAPSKFSAPDWQQWKIQGTTLEVNEERLKKRGLKDPWARNEAWRFSGGFSRGVTVSEVFFRGFKSGFVACAIALAVEYYFFPPKKSTGAH